MQEKDEENLPLLGLGISFPEYGIEMECTNVFRAADTSKIDFGREMAEQDLKQNLFASAEQSVDMLLVSNTSQNNTALLDAELEAMEAIYGSEPGFLTIIDLPPIVRNLKKRVTIRPNPEITVQLVIPTLYPSVCPVITKTTYTWMTERLEAFFEASFTPGCEVLLSTVQFVRDMAEDTDTATGKLKQPVGSNASRDSAVERANSDGVAGSSRGDGGAAEAPWFEGAEGEERGEGERQGQWQGEGEGREVIPHTSIVENLKQFARGPSNASNPSGVNITVTHGEPIVDRKSVFLGHACAVTSLSEVEAFRAAVLSDKKVSKATHNIFAYRFTDPATGVVHHDCDDDGENAAASRIAEMLRLMGLGTANSPGVAVIVSRWYGGIQLGPDRFKIMCNCARGVLEDSGFVASGVANQSNGSGGGGTNSKIHNKAKAGGAK